MQIEIGILFNKTTVGNCYLVILCLCGCLFWASKAKPSQKEAPSSQVDLNLALQCNKVITQGHDSKSPKLIRIYFPLLPSTMRPNQKLPPSLVLCTLLLSSKFVSNVGGSTSEPPAGGAYCGCRGGGWRWACFAATEAPASFLVRNAAFRP